MAEALGNISKSLVPLLVQPRVQEAQGGLATRQQRIVDQGEDTSSQWARCRSTRNGAFGPVPEVGKVQTLGSQIRVSAARLVVQTLVGIAERVNVLWHDAVLVPRAGEVVAKATAAGVEIAETSRRVATRAVSRFLGLKVHGRTDSRDVGAGGGEVGLELVLVAAVVCVAGICAAETAVAGGEEERCASGTYLGELLADTLGVGLGHGLLRVAVRGGDDAGNGVLGEQPVHPH